MAQKGPDLKCSAPPFAQLVRGLTLLGYVWLEVWTWQVLAGAVPPGLADLSEGCCLPHEGWELGVGI